MRNVLAIARLTFREGVRTRMVVVCLVLLALSLLLLPSVRGDLTRAGRLQTFLAYSLSATSLLLGLACVFLSCATLAGEFKTQTLYLVVTKPVTRLQVLLGKWLGINLLLGLLLLISGGVIYGVARYIKAGAAAFPRDEITVRDVIWRARVAGRPTPPPELEQQARQWVESQLKQGQEFARGSEYAVAQRMREMLTEWRSLKPGHGRAYLIEGLIPPRQPEQVVQVRYRVRGVPVPLDEMVSVSFAFADADSGQRITDWHTTRERIADLHQFLVRGQSIIRNGRALLLLLNPPQQNMTVFVDPEDGLQILYPVGSFEENYVKTLLIILARLGFLSAVGLLFGVFVSFPVACFVVMSVYVGCVGMPFILESVGAGAEYLNPKIDPYGHLGPVIRRVLLPLLHYVFPNFGEYDGARHLIAGEYIDYPLLGRALLHTAVYGALLLLVPAWLVFRAREVAEVTV